MAQAITYKRTTTDKLVLKGILNADATTMDCDGEEIAIADKLMEFADGYVEISIRRKTEEDLLTKEDDED